MTTSAETRQSIQEDAAEIIRLADRISGNLLDDPALSNIADDFDDADMKVGIWFDKLKLLVNGIF